MQNEIEQMAKDIEACNREYTELCRNAKCKECRYFYSTEDCYTIRLSEMLVAKGYRKSSDIARGLFEEIEIALSMHFCSCLPKGATEHYDYYEGDLGNAIAELKNKYLESEKENDTH